MPELISAPYLAVTIKNVAMAYPVHSDTVSVIATSAAIWSLSCQLQQQNELERKKVEASYLSKHWTQSTDLAISLMRPAQDTHELKNRIKALPAERAANYDASYLNHIELQRSMKGVF